MTIAATIAQNDPLVFLCGARDFHAMDWYRRAKELLPDRRVWILTDLIAGEGFKKIVNDDDPVHRLVIIDRFLLPRQSRFGNLWRNFVKLLVFPLQVALVRRFAAANPGAIYYAHAMYYLFLGMAAGIRFVGRPQGSDILIKPFRSKLFRYFAVKSMAAAKAVIVDSDKMKEAIVGFGEPRINVHVVRNGIDLDTIGQAVASPGRTGAARDVVLSLRGLTPLYRIEELLRARNASARYGTTPLTFIYPFYEQAYKANLAPLMQSLDRELGSLDKAEMYGLLARTRLVISIPTSDSSPRSVYEAVFCGCAVAISHHHYYDLLPQCMKSRIILVDPARAGWLDAAMDEAQEILAKRYAPSPEALGTFHQNRAFREMQALIYG